MERLGYIGLVTGEEVGDFLGGLKAIMRLLGM
jgi:hypothetical protein